MVNSLFSVLVFVLCCWHAKASSFELRGAFVTPWGHKSLCPPGEWAIGFKIKVEPKQGSGDDTAMNGIGLICGNRRVRYSVSATSAVGPWGWWPKHFATCRDGFTAARLKVEKAQGSGDDTGTNSVQLKCKSGTNIEALNAGTWGTWRSWGYCPRGLKIIGIQTMVEPKQGKGDDTALNSVRFFCG